MVGTPSSLDALLAAMTTADSKDPGQLLEAVLRDAAGPRAAAVWSRSLDGWLHRAAASGGRVVGPDRVPGTDALRGLPEVALVIPVVDGEVERGALTLGHLPGREPVDASAKAHAREAAGYVALLLRGPQLQEELRQRIDEAGQLSDALTASHERLAYAADLETRRMVADIVAFGGDELADLVERVGQMRDGRHHQWAGGKDSAPAALGELRRVLDSLIERLRTVVRDIYPYVLHDRGLLAALQELATSLSRPVHLRGDVGAVPREVESGLYWPTAAVLQALTGAAEPAAPAPVTVTLGLDEQHATVTISDPLWAAADAVGGVLPIAHDRLTALGGWLQQETGATGLVVRMALPEHLSPAMPARIATNHRSPVGPPRTDGAAADLRSRVRRLALAAADAVDARDRPAVRRVLARLDEPTNALGQAITPELAGVPETLAVLDEVTRRDPQGWLRYEYDRLRADAHDLDEMALIHDIRSGALLLPDAEARAALRLLGADGSSAATRLGRPDGDDPDQLRAAAAEQVVFWRAWAEVRAAGPRERAACRMLTRSAEGLLVRVDAAAHAPGAKPDRSGG
jgi:hypothetical protein